MTVERPMTTVCPVTSDSLVRVGLITKARGLRGELTVKPLTDDPERFRRLGDAYIEYQAPPGKIAAPGRVKIEAVRFHSGQVVVKFENCDDAEAASAYRGCYISVTRDQLVRPKKDSFFVFDLIGCSVFDAGGALLGELAEVLETGSNDVYVVRQPPTTAGEDADILIPALKSVVREVDVENKKIIVDYRGMCED